jgi:arginase
VISAAGQWTLVGAPLDSSGAGRGERNAPSALRAAGLVGALGAWDAGDADTVLSDATRDPVTGVIGLSGLVHASQVLRSTLRALLSSGTRPLVVGGDCTILLGILAAMRDEHASRIGLWFLDGHADFYDGSTSPTGEGADMELAIATGHGPAGLVDLIQPPLVAARDVVLLGHRRAEDDADIAEELGFLPADLFHVDATTIAEIGAAQVGQEAERRLASAVERAWLHLDLDVLDTHALPSVTYRQPRGLDWHDLSAMMAPLLASPVLAGVSVADYNPDRDPDKRYARRIVGFLADILGRRF